MTASLQRKAQTLRSLLRLRVHRLPKLRSMKKSAAAQRKPSRFPKAPTSGTRRAASTVIHISTATTARLLIIPTITRTPTARIRATAISSRSTRLRPSTTADISRTPTAVTQLRATPRSSLSSTQLLSPSRRKRKRRSPFHADLSRECFHSRFSLQRLSALAADISRRT